MSYVGLLSRTALWAVCAAEGAAEEARIDALCSIISQVLPLACLFEQPGGPFYWESDRIPAQKLTGEEWLITIYS